MLRAFLTIVLVVASVSLPAAPRASAAHKPRGASAVARHSSPRQEAPRQSAHRRSPYVGAIAADAATGRVLFEDNADQEAYPASVTKLMTLLLVVEDVRAGRYSFDDMVVTTKEAYWSEASWVGLKVGEKMSVRDLCAALMVESANDAAIVLGVRAAGSFDAFVARMNARAHELGMMQTRYCNPNGLPPNSSKRNPYPWKTFNVSTARDQMRLARALVLCPEVLSFTSIKTCDLIKTDGGYRVSVTRRVNEPLRKTQLSAGETIVKQMRNHNNVMLTDKLKILNPDGREAVDGLKTGYIAAGGSSVVLTGSRKGKRVIVVVLGSSSSAERDAQASRIFVDAMGSVVW